MRGKISSDAKLPQETYGGRYMAFLLRCWVEEEQGADQTPVWRFTLVKLNTNQRKRGFAHLSELFAYLTDEIASQAPQERLP